MNHEQRKTGIGGSDAAKICGVSKWGSPFSVYQEKKGLFGPQKDSVALELGNLLEPWLLAKYSRLTQTFPVLHPQMMRSKTHSFMIGNIDAISFDKKLLIELKTARNSDEWGEEGTSDVPLDYLCQVAHYLFISELEKSDIFVFFKDTETFKLFHVERDAELEKMIIEKEQYWWENYFLKDVSPEPTSIEETKLLFNKDNGENIEANFAMIEYCKTLKNTKAQIKTLEQEEEVLKLMLMTYMQNNETLTYDNKKLVTWKNCKTNRFDLDKFKSEHPALYNQYIKQSEQRRFLVK